MSTRWLQAIQLRNISRENRKYDASIKRGTLRRYDNGSLSSRFNALVTAWDSVDFQKQTLQGLTSLIKEEIRMKTTEESTSALAVINKSYKTCRFFKSLQDNRYSLECFSAIKRGM